VYNMLKLSRGLFMITGEKKYLDYYENTFYNSILSSQNPETGMTTYFQPMATGYFKTYGEPFTKFWCCTGSGMENFTKLNDSLYFYRGSDIFVNMYFDSVLNSTEHDLKLEIKTALPFGKKTCVKLTTLDGAKKTDRLKLIFKMPDWVDEPEKVVFRLNGTESGSATVIPGRDWAVVEGEFADGDVIEFELPMKLKAAGLPDDERVFGLKYGPLVLSADLGRENMSTTITGVDVTVPARKIAASEVIVLPDGVNAGDFAKDPEKYVTVEQPEGEGASVTVIPAGSKLRFSAHFLRYRDRYGIYFYYLTGDEAREAAAEGRFGNTEDVDTVMPGYGQYENDELHAMLEKDTESVTSGATYRIAKAGGAFSYRMAVDRSRKNRIRMMLRLCDNRKPLRISADGTDLYNDNLAYRGTDQYYPFEIELPGSVVAGAEHITANGAEYDVVTIAFSGTPEADSAAVCDFVKVVAY
ncbi:MAG: glycoside hydrolase family 127 protein, partial [Lachnospiraceae bacterium]|nr:glycoside hydrolase family 127 protein [Lachnospiraceae bacterium]